MDCIDLSIKNLDKKSKTFARDIALEFKPDVIIYVARGAFLIGKSMSEALDVPLIAVGTERKGNQIKEKVAPILGMLPRIVCNFLRSLEVKTNVHGKVKKREVHFLDDITYLKNAGVKNLLIIDDSVDTGNSIKAVKELVTSKFPESTTKLAALNVMSQSKSIITVDFSVYKDAMLRTPMSKDSREFSDFLKMYKQYNEKHI